MLNYGYVILNEESASVFFHGYSFITVIYKLKKEIIIKNLGVVDISNLPHKIHIVINKTPNYQVFSKSH